MADKNGIGLEAFIKMDAFKKAAGEYNRLIDNMNQQTDGVAGGITGKFEALGGSVLRVAGYLSGALVAAAAAGVAALTGLAVSGVKSAMDMEAQLSGIAAVLNKTNEEVKPLASTIVDLGLDPRLKVNAEEAADAIELLARNGLSMTEIMDGAAFSTVLLANSTGASFGDAANIATDAMAIFNIEAKDMQTAVDGITSVTTNSKFTIQDFALALANGGAVATSSGVDFDDFNTVIAAISPQFSSGMTAGTSFKNMLLRLAPTTNTAKDAMMELGLIAEDGTNAFYDSSGALKDMDEVAQILQDTFVGLSEEQRGMALRTIFGNEAMGSAIGLMNLGADSGKSAAEAFGELANTMGETDAAAAAATRMDNLAGVLEIIEGVIDTVKLQIGQAFLPLLRELADRLLVVADTVGPRVVEFFSVVSGFLDTFVTGLLNGQGPISAFLEALRSIGVDTAVTERIQAIVDSIGAFIAQVVTFVSEHSEAFKGALIGIGAVLAGAAIGAAILGIVGAIAALANPVTLIIGAVGLLGAAWSANWGGIQEKVAGAVAFVRPYVEQFVSLLQDRIGGAVANIRAWFEENWPLIQAVVLTAWTVIQDVIAAALAVIEPAITMFVENARNSLSQFGPLLDFLKQMWESLKPVIMGLLAILGAALLAFVGVVVGVVNGIAAAIGPLLDTFRNMAAGIITALTGLFDFVSGFFQLLVALFQGNSEAVKAAWEQMKQGLIDIVGGLVFAIVEMVTGLWETLKALVGGLVEGVIGFFKNLYDQLVGHSIIPDMVKGILEWILELKKKFVDYIKQLWLDIKSAFIEKVGEIIAVVTGFVQDIIDTFANTDWAEVGSNIISGIANSISAGASAIAEAARNAAGAALDAAKRFLGIDSPSKAFMEVGRYSMEGMALGVEKMKKRTAAAVSDVMSSLPGMNVDVNQALGGAFPGGSGLGLGMRSGRPATVALDAASMGALSGLAGGEVTNQYILNNRSAETDFQIRDSFSIMEMIGA